MISDHQSKQRVIAIEDPAGDNRFVTVIDGIPFYQSTGINSSHKLTWFPFMGILNQNYLNYKKGYFEKPNFTEFTLDLESYYPKKLSTFLRTYPNELIERFGNFECMCISLLLGGGFWECKEGKNLEKLIKTYFKENLDKISIKYKKLIENINLDILQHIGKKYYNDKDPQEINSWLVRAGSEAKQETIQLDDKVIVYHSIDFKSQKKKIDRQVEGLIEKVNQAIDKIKNPQIGVANIEYNHKMLVLEGAIRYLKDEIDSSQFTQILNDNPHYGGPVGNNQIARIINEILEYKQQEEPKNSKRIRL